MQKKSVTQTGIRFAHAIKLIVFHIIFLQMTNHVAMGQNELDVIRGSWMSYTDAPNSLYHFMNSVGFDLVEKREAESGQIRNKEEFLERQAEIRKRMWNIIGPFREKTPLNARITSTISKKDYRIENIIYESLPGFYVTASLFIPKNIRKPAPAILFCSGHSSGAYRLPLYQLPLLNLVRKGFIVLAIDPVGQGERLQYFDPGKGESEIGGSTEEHSYASVQVFLLGKSIARYFLWDGIRGLDYLVSRKEVDTGRIGVHGLSGGGTQTAFISALDERVAASAIACYITSYRRLMESIGVQDGEQNFYHGLLCGIDHADLIESRAPRPTLVMATTGDFFSIAGTRETDTEVKRIYELLNAPGNLELTEDDSGHGYTKLNRERMYAFFQKYLNAPGSSSEEEVEFLSAGELQKTSTGQLATSLGGETIYSVNRKEAMGLLNERSSSVPADKANLISITASAKSLSGYQEPSVINDPVFTGRIHRDGYVIEKYFVKGERDHIIPYLVMIPERTNGKALIYLDPSGKSARAGAGGELEWFVRKGFTVLAPDLIGIGETGPGSFRGDAYIDSISYNIWFSSVLTGSSIVGVRAGEVVSLARLTLRDFGTKELYGVARKELCPVLLHAEAFDHCFEQIALIAPYSSYKSIVMNRFYDPRFVYSVVPGALTAYDLPDLAASFSPGKLLIAGCTDGTGKISDSEEINMDLNFVRASYKADNASGNLKITTLTYVGSADDIYADWIK